MRAIVYGAGFFWKYHRYLLPVDTEIIAYADSSKTRATRISGEMIDGKPILSPDELKGIEFDTLVIGTDFGTANRIFEILMNMNLNNEVDIRFLARDMKTLLLSGECVDWHYEVLRNGIIKSRIGDVTMIEKGGSDYDTISEVFGDCMYHMSLESDTVLVDIGMNVGYVSLLYAQDKNVVRIYGYEPFPDTYAQALENISLNSDKIREKIIATNVGLGYGETQLQVVATTDGTARRSIYTSSGNGEHVEIQCCDAGRILTEIINENEGRNILLKIDTEGAEYDIFKSMEKMNVFEKIYSIIMEYHREPNVLINTLIKHNFRCHFHGFSSQGMLIGMNMNISISKH